MNLGDKETLFEKDGWLYVPCEVANWSKPERYIHYWPLKVRWLDFAHRFRSTEEALAAIGSKMRSLGNGAYEGPLGLVYCLKDGAQTKPEWTETEDVPKPQQRGHKLSMEWRNGAWYKQTKRGWQLA